MEKKFNYSIPQHRAKQCRACFHTQLSNIVSVMKSLRKTLF